MSSRPSPGPKDFTATLINPYAPAQAVVADVEFLPAKPHRHVNTLALITSVMTGVTLSGGVFGFGLALLIAPAPLTMVAGTVVGCFLAFTASVPIVPVIGVGNLLFAQSKMPWTPLRIGVTGAICGFLCGYVWMPIWSFSPLSFFTGFVPGFVGAIGTLIAVTPLMIRSKQAWQLQGVEDL